MYVKGVFVWKAKYDLHGIDELEPSPLVVSLTEGRPTVRILLAAPRGFCAGVRRAIDAVRGALEKHGQPIFVRRAIVHNLEVVRTLEAEGAVFVHELDEVPEGGVVLFSAHGVSPAIAADAERRGLTAYDAVCPLVAKVHREVERHQRCGRQIILVGHKDHPEIAGTLGHISSVPAHVVNSVEDVALLPLSRDEPTAYAVQTTYSVDDANAIVEAMRAQFADLVGPASSDICYATTNRQAAVREVARKSDIVLVVGARFSSNACRLVEVAGVHCAAVQLVAGPADIDWGGLPRAGVIGITAAASTPETSVDAIVSALAARYEIAIEEMGSALETTVFKPMSIA